jgi:hypothetical protein
VCFWHDVINRAFLGGKMNVHSMWGISGWLIVGGGVAVVIGVTFFCIWLLIDRFIAVYFGGVPLKHAELKDLKPPARGAFELMQWITVPILAVSYVAHTQAWAVLAAIPVYLIGLSFWKLYCAG